jgi:hypothetical protein
MKHNFFLELHFSERLEKWILLPSPSSLHEYLGEFVFSNFGARNSNLEAEMHHSVSKRNNSIKFADLSGLGSGFKKRGKINHRKIHLYAHVI